MVKSKSILLVEDESTISMDFWARLQTEGYGTIRIASTGRKALAIYQEHPVDVVISDIKLPGKWTGIDTALRLKAHRSVPIIYLSTLTDSYTLELAKYSQPAAFLPKPTTIESLRLAIEIALSNFAYCMPPVQAESVTSSVPSLDSDSILQFKEYLFIKQNYQFFRLHQSEILYAEADDKYTTLVTANRKFVMRSPITVLLNRLANTGLIQVHRSFAVNLTHVVSFSDSQIQVVDQTVPLGRVYKEDFLRSFQFR